MTGPVDYDDIAASYDARYRANDDADTERAIRAFAGVAGLGVLEVGCGTGHWLEVTVQAYQHAAFQAAFSGSAPASERPGAY